MEYRINTKKAVINKPYFLLMTAYLFPVSFLNVTLISSLPFTMIKSTRMSLQFFIKICHQLPLPLCQKIQLHVQRILLFLQLRYISEPCLQHINVADDSSLFVISQLTARIKIFWFHPRLLLFHMNYYTYIHIYNQSVLHFVVMFSVYLFRNIWLYSKDKGNSPACHW